MYTATIELVIIPLAVAIILYFIGIRIIRWKNRIIRLSYHRLRGNAGVNLFVLSLFMLGSFSMFLSLFFLITA